MAADWQKYTDKTLVLVGLMGAGKSTVGRRLAERLDLPFVDSDDEIVEAADMAIPDIFSNFGEQYFRDGEERVIERLLNDPVCILSTGGGAFLSDKTRALIATKATSIWLRADLATLWDRVSGKPGRPLLELDNPKKALSDLMESRYPIYGQADLIVDSKMGNPHEDVVDKIVSKIKANK